MVVNFYVANNTIQKQTLNQIDQLLNAIEPSAQISAYLNDKSIAREIGRGLIKTPVISQVELVNADNQTLTLISQGKSPTERDTVIKRKLSSPFDSSVKVGVLTLVLDHKKINAQKLRHLVSVLMPTVLQTFAVILAIIWTGLSVLLPKISVFLNDLEKLDVKQGALLDTRKYRQGGEFGRISEYINDLVQKMYNALESERSLRNESEIQHRRMEAIIENARTGIFVADKNGRLLSYNNACQAISLREGQHLNPQSTVLDLLSPDLGGAADQITSSLAHQQKLHLEIFLPAKEGHREQWLQLNLTPIDEQTIQGVINDISAIKNESIAAQTLARTDPLTQLGNRLGFDNEFKRRLANTAQAKHSLTLMSLDLDRFKAVNDNYGHDAGDQVLVYVAHQLQHIIRSSDFIGRMGGDEFNILLDDINQDMSAKLAARIVSSLNQPIILEPGKEVQIGVSIGVVYLAAGLHADPSDLLRQADKTMYRVKNHGRNDYCIVNFVGS